MKILHIINSLGTGGAEKLIIESLPIMKQSGIDVDLFLLKSDNFPFEITLREDATISIYKSKFSSIYNPLHTLSIIPLLKKYDIVHVHLFPALYWVALSKVVSFSKVKLVFTEHSPSNRRLDKWYFKAIDSIIYSQYTKIISISEKVEEMLIKKMKIHRSKVHLIKNGINLDSISFALPIPKAEIHRFLNNNHTIIIQISRFQAPKDQQTLIKMMKLLPENVILLLVGEGETKLKCEQLTKQLNLEDRIFFLGVRMDVPQLLKTANIVVLSSHYEGLSLASIEALASSKPFIASRVPGLIEVVENVGLLFDASNEVELANLVNALLNDQDFYCDIAQKCLAKSKEYDIIKMVFAEIELYKTLL